jgi:ABC-type nitrate/sulfonate/bicarbonate transport system substrate-binding protein
MPRSPCRWLLAAMLLAPLLACGPPSTPASAPQPAPAVAASPPLPTPAPMSLTVGRAAVRVTVAPFWLARELGFFAKYGLAVEDSVLRAAAAVEAALLANEIQFGLTGLAAVLTARAGGSDSVLTASYLDVALGEFVVRPEIRQPADLRGRIMGVQSIGGTIHIRGLLALRKLGLDVERDNIQVLVVGDDPTLAQSLIAGAIDAAPVSYTSARIARANGMHGWDLGELGVPESSVSVITTQAFARERPEIVERFLKGLAEGVYYLKQGRTDPAKRERALQIVAANLKVAPEDVAFELDKVAELARVNLQPDLAALAEFRTMVVQQTPAVERITLDDVIDLRFLQRLEREGYFATLQPAP